MVYEFDLFARGIEENKELLCLQCGRARKLRSRRIPKGIGSALDVIVVPVCNNDKQNICCNVDVQLFEVPQGNRLSDAAVKARVNNHPFARSQVNNYAFTKSWTEQR